MVLKCRSVLVSFTALTNDHQLLRERVSADYIKSRFPQDWVPSEASTRRIHFLNLFSFWWPLYSLACAPFLSIFKSHHSNLGFHCHIAFSFCSHISLQPLYTDTCDYIQGSPRQSIISPPLEDCEVPKELPIDLSYMTFLYKNVHSSHMHKSQKLGTAHISRKPKKQTTKEHSYKGLLLRNKNELLTDFTKWMKLKNMLGKTHKNIY